MHFRIEHEFDIDPKAYWDIFFDEEYNRDLYREMKMQRTLVDQKDDGKVLRRTVRLTPAQSVPAAFQAVIKDTSYTEHDVFHRERSSMEVVIEPAMMKNKFDFKAVYSVVPVGPPEAGKCRRVFEGDMKVSVMIIGGQIEKYMIETIRASYDTATAVTRRWIEKRKQASA